MEIYFLPILIVVLLIIADDQKKFILHENEKKIKIEYLILFFVPVLMMALRGVSAGVDTINYLNIFDRISLQSWNQVLEIDKDRGYYIFVKLLTLFTSNSQVLIIVTSLFVGYAYANFFSKQTKYSILATVGYLGYGLFAFHLTGLRQSIAMAICLISYRYIEEKKLIKFLILVILASTIHQSALIFIIAYLVGQFKSNYFSSVVFIMFGVISYVYAAPLLNYITLNFDQYSQYGIESTGNGMIFFLVISLITVLGFTRLKQMVKKKPSLAIALNLNYIAWIFWILRLVSRSAERMCFYFLPATIVVLCESLGTIKSDRDRGFMFLFAILMTVALYLYRFRNLTYNFFWTN